MQSVGEVPQSLAFTGGRFSGFKKGVEALPYNLIVFAPDTSIIAASDLLLQNTYTNRKGITNRGLFEVFPPPPENSQCSEKLAASFDRVIETRRMDIMSLLRYDIPLPKSMGGGFEKRFWKNVSYPVFDRKGNLLYLALAGEDVTQEMLPSKPASGLR